MEMNSRGNASTRELQVLAVNSSWIMVAHVFANACSLLMNWMLVRAYGQTLHSQITLLVSIMTTVTLIADLGLASKYGVRKLARLRFQNRERLSAYVSTTLLLLLILAISFSLSIIFLSSFLSDLFSLSRFAVIMLACWVLGSTLQRACSMVAISFEKMQWLVLFTVVSQFLLCGWSGVSLAFLLPIEQLYIGWSIIWGLAILAGGCVVVRLLREFSVNVFAQLLSARETGKIIKETIPYFIPVLSSTGLPALCFVLVGLHSEDNLSILQVCFSLALVGRVISQPIATALFPILSRLDQDSQDSEQTGIIIHQVIRGLGLVMSLVFIGTWLLGEWVLSKYSPEYTRGLYALVLFTVGVTIEGYKTQLDQILMASRYVGITVRLEVVKVLLIAGGVLVFVRSSPLYALPGVLVLSSLIVTFIRVMFVQKLCCKAGGKPALSTVVVFIAVSLTALYLGNALCIIGVGVAAMWRLKLFRISDLGNIKNAVKR